MKFLPAIFLLLLVSNLNGQQKKFLPIKNNSNLVAPVFPLTLAEIFESPLGVTSITIFADELKNVSLYDFSKLEDLELVQVKFTIAPDSSDAARKVFIDSINVLMKNMSAFSKCPKLKKVVFCIGEQIYLKHAQTDADDAYKGNVRQKLFDANVANAWIAFGKDVSVQLPGVKLYGLSWGW